ncbi:MAG: glycosyltransferase family 8 protein [Clostridia bacterium]|nr:glycosyltransferase family 8 protein [Clostridia bacterium]
MKEIPVFFSIDNSYAPFLAAAIHSAVQNCSPDRQYKAIILHQELTQENQEKLSKLATENFSVEFVEMKEGLESITDRMSNRLRCDYFTLTIYFRLFIPTMFPQYDKGIYIDSDVVVLGDLAELFDTDIGENYIGACADKSVVDVPELARYMEEAVGVSRYDYINSGVLLMNLKALREIEFDKHFLGLLNTYHFDCIAPDQDYINAICNGKIHYLDEIWDAMPNDNAPPLDNAKLIHYNLFSKPWCYDGIQYGGYFWEYIKDTGYENEAKSYKANYSDAQKKSDSDCLGLLVRRGSEICEMPVTFKKMQDNGVKIRL